MIKTVWVEGSGETSLLAFHHLPVSPLGQIDSFLSMAEMSHG
ncbi:hypothetical protein SynA1560_00930 [Synechococcus sp. A15-60]|nr:hypothetical protein SynA1560_00930 [Synechococcus sp. A15-60]